MFVMIWLCFRLNFPLSEFLVVMTSSNLFHSLVLCALLLFVVSEQVSSLPAAWNESWVRCTILQKLSRIWNLPSRLAPSRDSPLCCSHLQPRYLLAEFLQSVLFLIWQWGNFHQTLVLKDPKWLWCKMCIIRWQSMAKAQLWCTWNNNVQ